MKPRIIKLHGRIGGEVTLAGIEKELEAAGGGPVHLDVHSEGGSVLEGIAIHGALKRYAGRVTAEVRGMCLSMAVTVICAAEHITMPENAWIMVHAVTSDGGRADARSMERNAELLKSMDADVQRIVADRTGQPVEAIAEMMADETWLTAAQAKLLGLVDEVTVALKAAAVLSDELAEVYSNAPACVMPTRHKELVNASVMAAGETRRFVAAADRICPPSDRRPPASMGAPALRRLLNEASGKVLLVDESFQNAVDRVVARDISDGVLNAAAAQGVPVEDDAALALEMEDAIHEGGDPFEIWARMPRGSKRSQFYREYQSEILRGFTQHRAEGRA